MEISKTGESKQTLNQCCLKSRFGTKSNSWWSNCYKMLKQLLFEIRNLLNLGWFTLEVMNAPCPQRALHDILPLLNVFSKNYTYIIEKPIHALYRLYITLANISVVFQEQRPLESSQKLYFYVQNIYRYIYISNRIIGYIFIYNKWCKFNVDLYWTFKNVIIYRKYTLKFLVFEVIYFIFL